MSCANNAVKNLGSRGFEILRFAQDELCYIPNKLSIKFTVSTIVLHNSEDLFQ